MKKLLSLLLTTGLTATTATTVTSCVKANGPIADVSDEETLALLKNQFVAEVKEIMKNFISIRSQKLFQSETTSAPNLFLNQTTLAQIYGDATAAVTHTLTATEKSNLIADINKILEIESELKKEVQKTMSEQTKYSFLLEGIDSIYKSITFADNIQVAKQGADDNYIYNIIFDISIEFNYKYNSVIETDMFKPANKLNFGIAKNDSIVSSIQAITRDLGQWMYTNHYNDFTFDETKLGRTKGLYSAQNEQVVLNKQANKDNLVETIKDIITDDLKLVVDSVEFELNTSGVYKNLYNQTVKIPVSDNGFVENAIFLKNDEVSESDLVSMFNQDMGDSLKTSTFMNDSKATILNNLNIEVDLEKNNAEYSEYGYISLSSMTINIQGLKVDVNPINLLYVYKPTKAIATGMISTLKAWESAWNIKKTEDRYALFKMSEENSELTSQIWTSIAASPYSFLNSVNKEKNKYYGQILETSAFNDFYINHKFLMGWSSRSAVDSKGYSMDYETGFGIYEKNWYKYIWELYFNFDEFKLQLDFTSNVSYKENLWYGSNKGKYAIEK